MDKEEEVQRGVCRSETALGNAGIEEAHGMSVGRTEIGSNPWWDKACAAAFDM
jgi:hypothetical protein